MKRLSTGAMALVAAFVSLATPSCGSDGVVGGGCADGYVLCNGVCIDVQHDALNCGACGHQCGSGESCLAGACSVAGSGGKGGSAGASGASGTGGASGASGAAGSSGAAGGGKGGAGQGGTAGAAGQGGAGASGASGNGGASGAGAGGKGGVGGVAGSAGASGAGAGGKGGVGGTAGSAGASGMGGASGSAGASGMGGASGSSGASGTGGASGAGGASGMGGAGGSSGASGMGGASGAGGGCADKVCNGVCVDTTTDPNNCSDCGIVCSTGVCQGSTCTCVAPLENCNGTCVDTTTDPNNCGMCNIVCSTGVCAGSMCVCPAPKVPCNGVCVDTSSDADNCGMCNNPCATGVCQGSTCVGAAPGHEVIIGMSYADVPSSVDVKHSNARLLLGNSVFLNSASAGGTWKVLAFDPFGSPSAANVDTIVNAQKGSHGVTTLTIDHVTDPAMTLSKLNIASYNALVVYDQPAAATGELGNEGAFLGSSVRAFAKAGGTVVILSGGTGIDEMWDFVGQAQLFGTTGFALVSSDAASSPPLTVPPPVSSDVTVQGVSNVFISFVELGAWSITLDAGADVVVTTQVTGAAVAVHRSVN